jgi:DNA-binding NarL/FixJ family response regulator
MKQTFSTAGSFDRDAARSLAIAATPSLAIATTPWLAPGAGSRDQREPDPASLTPRQLEVLALLCEGLPNKLICRRLNIATGTVKVHISCILRELGVTSRLQAVVAAQRHGLRYS